MKFIVVASVAFFEGAETLSVEILFTLEQFEIAYNAAVCVTRGDFKLAVMTNLYPIVDLHIRVGLDLFGIFILVVIISALHKHGLRWPRRPSRVRAGRPRRAAGVIRRARGRRRSAPDVSPDVGKTNKSEHIALTFLTKVVSTRGAISGRSFESPGIGTAERRAEQAECPVARRDPRRRGPRGWGWRDYRVSAPAGRSESESILATTGQSDAHSTERRERRRPKNYREDFSGGRPPLRRAARQTPGEPLPLDRASKVSLSAFRHACDDLRREVGSHHSSAANATWDADFR